MKPFRTLTFDAKGSFKANAQAEKDYARSLKKLARAVGGIVETHIDGTTIIDEAGMLKRLAEYSKVITPWATKQSALMVKKVSASNKRAWQSKSQLIGRLLRENLAEGHVDLAAQKLVHEQVNLIQSIPKEAGERAQKLAMEAALNGKRSSEVAKELMRTTDVTESRAVLIARTETARSNAAISRARAQSVDSTQYIWHTADDGDVRESHAEMEGTIQSWDDPPTLSDDMTGNPGEFPNCRCWAEPILPTNE